MTRYGPGTALLVVDVQNDFADPRGSLYVMGGQDVVPVVNREIEQARAASALVVYTQDWHPESTPHFEKDGGIWPVHCVRESWGAELRPDLMVAGEVLRKGVGGEDGYSAFGVRDPRSGRERGTGLEERLRVGGVEQVVIAGLATDYCVKETALDARRLGLQAVVLTGAIRAVNLEPEDGTLALRQIEEAGALLD